jgi:hypothetical protein
VGRWEGGKRRSREEGESVGVENGMRCIYVWVGI